MFSKSPWAIALGVLTAFVLAVIAVAVPIASRPPRPSSAASPSVVMTEPLPTTTSDRTHVAPTPSSTVSETPSPATGIEVGQLAPDFELQTPAGEPVALSDFRGHPVWINFWAPWCPACRTEMPRLEGFYLQRRDAGLVILGVGVRDSADSMQAYVHEVGVSYPIVVDGDAKVAARYRAFALPVHYWIDRDGVIRDWALGELPPDLLAASLESIL
jgi:cytochrome c biogenesis protein CcmG/thiol:disulfide interchange protein DsbE